MGNPPLGEISHWKSWLFTQLSVSISEAKAFWAAFQYKDHLSRYGDSHVKDKTVVLNIFYLPQLGYICNIYHRPLS